jgi:hypothetical protein
MTATSVIPENAVILQDSLIGGKAVQSRSRGSVRWNRFESNSPPSDSEGWLVKDDENNVGGV